MNTRGVWITLLGAVTLLATLIFLQGTEAKRVTSDVNSPVAAKAPASGDKLRKAKQPTAKAQEKDGTVTSVASYQNDVSPNLRDIKAQPYFGKIEEREAAENPKIPHSPHKDSADTVIQDTTTSLMGLITPSIPSPILTFDGIVFPGVGCNCAPPDTDGEVGQTQYVQMVNEGVQVFNKGTGASLFGPVGISTLWTGFGGVCETNGSGDPVVLYDQLANRWVITQFAGVSVPTDECVAVSTTNDATGSYNRYAFHLGTNFFDYPHLSVWPNAYYMSMNVFNAAGTAFLGPQPFAFDRAKMLAGLPATFVTTGVTGGANEDVYLPADLDGSILPPANAPGVFVETPFTNTYRVFHFAPDFVTPANTTFTLFAAPAAAPFTELCPTTRACVPEPGAQSLDGIGDRLMFRLATRFFADGHEATVGNMTVSANGVAGIRWFELRNATNGPVTVAQESTYQPDTTWRWMGSAAMDQQGDLAIGFSASSATVNPQIRYAARLANDPINTLAQGEATMFAGTGAQSGTGNRWGDYSDLTVDPVDDCTFWYTNEYYAVNGTFNWRTRIGKFKLPGCGIPTPIVTAAGSTLVNESCPPNNGVIDPGETATVSLALNNSGDGATNNLVATLVASSNVLAPSGPQSYGAIPIGGTVSRAFTFTANGNCGDIITLTLQLQDGATNYGTVTYTFRLGTVVVGSTTNTSYTGPPVAIPDNNAAGVNIPFVVNGISGQISDANFGFDGTTCSSAIGSTTVGLDHTWVGDLIVKLTSPQGTTVILMNRPGGTGNSGNNFCQTLLDDSAVNAIQTIPVAGAPWTGNFKPANVLSAFNGENPNGTWTLNVSDNAGIDTGNVRAFTLSITPQTFVCNNACAGTPRIVTSTALSCSGGNTVGTITVTNSGTATANNVVLTTAKIGGVSGTPLPQSLGNLAAGASVTTTVTFSGAPSGTQSVQVGGTYTGGSYNGSRKMNAPSCNVAGNMSPATPFNTLPALLAAMTFQTVLTGR